MAIHYETARHAVSYGERFRGDPWGLRFAVAQLDAGGNRGGACVMGLGGRGTSAVDAGSDHRWPTPDGGHHASLRGAARRMACDRSAWPHGRRQRIRWIRIDPDALCLDGHVRSQFEAREGSSISLSGNSAVSTHTVRQAVRTHRGYGYTLRVRSWESTTIYHQASRRTSSRS